VSWVISRSPDTNNPQSRVRGQGSGVRGATQYGTIIIVVLLAKTVITDVES